jgi:ADP-ribose pyrophosphatase YjhB (NUDIX family)/phosphohistidine phosphatase SixA
VLVHRPRYDDWTLPKGKALDGESDEDCARREVEEETGLRCELLFELPSTSYQDGRGRTKRVRYWAMRPLGGEFAPHDEVDEVRWLAPAEAKRVVTYDRDRLVLRAFGFDGSRPVLLIRHAIAVKRSEWAGNERARPLDQQGCAQARRLVRVLGGHELEEVLSSPHQRCLETVQPLAAELRLAVELRDELAEGSGAGGLLSVIPASGAAALCVHKDVLDDLFGERLPKGSTTLVELHNGTLVRVATLPPPLLDL